MSWGDRTCSTSAGGLAWNWTLMADADRFCDDCFVSLDLHAHPDEDDPAERGCEGAQIREQLFRTAWWRPL
jgi:hypothetical protein